MINASRLMSIADYCMVRNPVVEYIGCLGIKNLGDEALLDAAKGIFTPTAVRPAFSPINRHGALGKAINRPRQHMALLGGGTLICNGYYIRSFEEHMERLGIGAIFGTGVEDPMFVQDDLDVFGSEVRRALSKARYIGVRGPLSRDYLINYGVESKIEVIGDLACWFTKTDDFWKPISGAIGVNVGHSNGRFFGSEDALIKTIGRVLGSLARDGVKVTFFVVWPEDLQTTHAVINAAGIKDAVIVSEYRDPEKYMSQVARMELFIGVKLHAVVLAMCAGVPSVALEYRPKCRDFMASVGAESSVIRTDKVSPELLQEAIKALHQKVESRDRPFLSRMQHYRDIQIAKAEELRQCLIN